MPLTLKPVEMEKPALQRQLDADQLRWSRELQQATDAAFEPEEINTFRMTGLYGHLPGSESPALRLRAKS